MVQAPDFVTRVVDQPSHVRLRLEEGPADERSCKIHVLHAQYRSTTLVSELSEHEHEKRLRFFGTVDTEVYGRIGSRARSNTLTFSALVVTNKVMVFLE